MAGMQQLIKKISFEVQYSVVVIFVIIISYNFCAVITNLCTESRR